MNNKEKKIDSLEKLTLEKHELKAYCAYQEKLIAYKFEELRKNYPDILIREILPFDSQKNSEINSLLDTVNHFVISLFPTKFLNSRFGQLLLKLVETMAIRVFSKATNK